MPMAKTTLETFVSPEELRDVILDFESYPDFVTEVKKVDVKERTEKTALVTFHIALSFGGFDIATEYTVRYAIAPLEISWTLESSPTITKNVGRWELEETDDGECIARYEAEVETNLGVPPEVQRLFVEESLPKLMALFRDRAEG